MLFWMHETWKPAKSNINSATSDVSRFSNVSKFCRPRARVTVRRGKPSSLDARGVGKPQADISTRVRGWLPFARSENVMALGTGSMIFFRKSLQAIRFYHTIAHWRKRLLENCGLSFNRWTRKIRCLKLGGDTMWIPAWERSAILGQAGAMK
jgi:hypothetical protein